MPNNAKYEKNLKKMQQRLDILAPVLRDAHDSCFSMCKFLVVTSITLHGGAIGIILASFISASSITLGYFLFGIFISFLMAILFIPIDKFNLCEHYKITTAKHWDYELALDTIKKEKRSMYALIYFSSFISFALFTFGTLSAFENSLLITSI